MTIHNLPNMALCNWNHNLHATFGWNKLQKWSSWGKASILPDKGLSLTLAKGGGDATGVVGFDEYDPPLSVG